MNAPLKTFLNLESHKKVYNKIFKLSIKNPNFDSSKPTNDDNITNIITTDQKEIRKETGNFFQNIYNKQENVNSSKDEI